MTKIFEVKITPVDRNSPIEWILIRLPAADINKCLDIIEENFPKFNVETVMEGYKDDSTARRTPKNH